MEDHTNEQTTDARQDGGPEPLEQLVFSDECPDEADFRWAAENEDLRRLYGGLLVVVSQRTVWGSGRTFDEAWEDAQRKPNCPPLSDCAFVPISASR